MSVFPACRLSQYTSGLASFDIETAPFTTANPKFDGHLDTLRQGIASTRKSPSPSALSLPLTHATHRRLAFLHDYDLSESASLDVSPTPSPATLTRRSSRLAAPSPTERSQSTTSHRSEWLDVCLGYSWLDVRPNIC